MEINMIKLISCFLIAIALSMDTFSLSLGLGTYNPTKKSCITLSITVGLMHFIMPLIGNIIGESLITFFTINSNFLLGCILLFIAGNLFISILKEEQLNADFSLIGIFLFAFGVSLDAFSTGLGLKALEINKYFAFLIFSLVSMIFTFFGLLIGCFASKHLGKKASILGVILLFTLGIFHICK